MFTFCGRISLAQCKTSHNPNIYVTNYLLGTFRKKTSTTLVSKTKELIKFTSQCELSVKEVIKPIVYKTLHIFPGGDNCFPRLLPISFQPSRTLDHSLHLTRTFQSAPFLSTYPIYFYLWRNSFPIRYITNPPSSLGLIKFYIFWGCFPN